MTPEERIAELELELTAVHAALSELHAKLDTTIAVVELLLHRSATDQESVLDLAKALDRLAAVRSAKSRRDDLPDLIWLEQLRGDLLTRYRLAPAIQKAIAEGQIRPRPMKDELKLVKKSDGSFAEDASTSPPEDEK